MFAVDALWMPLSEYCGLRYILSPLFSPPQFFTYMFLHADFGHLFSNMLALFAFGPLIERFFGYKKFLFFYLICGVGAGVIYSIITYFQMYSLDTAIQAYIASPSPTAFVQFINQYAESYFGSMHSFMNLYETYPQNEKYIQDSIEIARTIYTAKANVPMIGASGAVFGILMAAAMIFPNSEMFLFPFPFPIKVKYFVGVYGLIELYSGVHNSSGDNVAHFAHIGGMIFAFILIKLWTKNSGSTGSYY